MYEVPEKPTISFSFSLEAQWSLLLMSFLLIISITHQHFFRDQHFQISKFSQINFLSQHQHESGNAYPTKNDSCQTNIFYSKAKQN